MAAASSFSHPHPHPQGPPPQTHQPQPGNPASKDPAGSCLSISAAGAASFRAPGGILSLSISGSMSFNSTKSRRTTEAPARRLRAVSVPIEPSIDFEYSVSKREMMFDEYLLRSGRDTTFKSLREIGLLGLDYPQQDNYGVIASRTKPITILEMPHRTPRQHVQPVGFDSTLALGVDFMVDDCSTATCFDHTLTEQVFVAVDKKTPINQDLISKSLSDPVHGAIKACALVRPKGDNSLIVDTGFVRTDI